MITQAIKQWLQKVFGWWRPQQKTEYLQTPSSLSQGATQGMTARSTSEGVSPRRSTIEEWPERIVQPSPPLLEERAGTSFPPPPSEKIREAKIEEGSASSISPNPMAERQLEFLRYLVKRGLVNEGFAEGTIPDQYRKE
jgi:hypothetical protein